MGLNRVAAREGCHNLGFVVLLCVLFTGACASPPRPAVKATERHEAASKPAPLTRPADASAAYHFMLGYQAELSQNTEQALKEYQAALKADPTSLSVKARLASLHFALGDLPGAMRYAEEVADGNSEDSRILTHMAGILAGGGKGDRPGPRSRRGIFFERSVTAESQTSGGS